jgi:hypothetical protein
MHNPETIRPILAMVNDFLHLNFASFLTHCVKISLLFIGHYPLSRAQPNWGAMSAK